MNFQWFNTNPTLEKIEILSCETYNKKKIFIENNYD